jgi:succinate dehydrogenase/fumarate reductase flavoprotein subunit
MLQRLQAVMSDDVGPLRTRDGLVRALAAIDKMTHDIGERPFGDGGAFDMVRLDWFDLRNMLLVAHTVARAALARTESRGAHQREDHPGMLPEWRVNQVVRLSGRVSLASVPAIPVGVAAQ